MKGYHLRKNVATHLQGIILVILALAAHKTNADEASVMFAIMGIAMLCGNIHYYIYKAARKIVRYGNREEWYIR